MSKSKQMHNNATYVADFKSNNNDSLDASRDAGDAKHLATNLTKWCQMKPPQCSTNTYSACCNVFSYVSTTSFNT